MTVTLTPEQEKFITEQVKNGHFESADEAVMQGLGILQAQEEFIRTNTVELQKKLDVGLEQIRRGEVVDAEVVIKNARERLRRREHGGK